MQLVSTWNPRNSHLMGCFVQFSSYIWWAAFYNHFACCWKEWHRRGVHFTVLHTNTWSMAPLLLKTVWITSSRNSTFPVLGAFWQHFLCLYSNYSLFFCMNLSVILHIEYNLAQSQSHLVQILSKMFLFQVATWAPCCIDCLLNWVGPCWLFARFWLMYVYHNTTYSFNYTPNFMIYIL